MKQKLQLQIPEPCHENWNNMTETQQGRFCMSCKKEVIDFSVMGDKEILNYISTASSNMCGRVSDGQLNRDLISPREPKKIGWRYWVSIAASFVLLTAKSNAQGKKQKDPVVAVPPANIKNLPDVVLVGAIAYLPEYKRGTVIRGRVVDEKNNPVPFASVKIKYSATGVAADADGYFVLHMKEAIDYVDLQVSSVGYKSKTIEAEKEEMESNKIEAGNIILKTQKMDTVVVTGGSSSFRITSGLMAVCVKATRYEKTKAAFKEVFAVNEIKIYPNPIAVNSNFNIGFKLKEQGDYIVQFTDVSGKIISSRQLNITSKNQLESFDSNIFQAHGMYFVSVRGRLNGKMYTTKLLVQ